MDSSNLPPDLLAALRTLPDEVAPPPGEEDRTVRALRRRGLLPPPRWRRYGVPLTRVAAALVIFAAGAVYGDARATRWAMDTLLEQRDRDTRATALLVQRAGSAYVRALGDLARDARSTPADPALAGGREAALATLRAAAAQLQLLAPPDAVNADLRGTGTASPQPDARKVYWF